MTLDDGRWDTHKLAKEIRSCLAGGWDANVGASGRVYVEPGVTKVGDDPIIYVAQAGRQELTQENMLELAHEALEAIEQVRGYDE
jgi:hypothetical protein